MLPESDRVRLLHMLDATRDAVRYARGRSRDDLDRDSMLFRALVNCLEIVGEAASRTSADTRRRFPSVPWAQMNAMRNRLIHAYYDVNRDTVWGTVVRDLPSLERELGAILGVDLPDS